MAKINVSELKLTEDQNEVFSEAMKSIAKHNEAAIHLVTSGGKSYIIAKIIQTLKEQDKRRHIKVLYVSTAGSCKNFLQCMSDEYWEDSINVINFTQLQRDESFVDTLKLKKCDIIVIDEAHCALAKKTYNGIQYIRNKFPNATIVAMSANSRRYDERRDVFKWLTPKLTLGVDYQDRGLKYAVANEKICNFEYKFCDIGKVKRYRELFSQIQYYNKFNDTENLIEDAKKLIEKYENNSFETVEEQMKSDLIRLGIDGRQGDRWFVFFNTIAELKESKDNIQKLFEHAYNSNQIKVVVHEYHGKNTNVKDAEEALLGKPEANRVDVVLTCLKGGMSFHPENTRGLVINRRSGSENLITQELGRALQIRDLCKDTKLIYDLVGITDTIDITQSIFSGSQKPEDRDIIASFDLVNNYDADIVKELENEYGSIGQYSTIYDINLEELLDKFEYLKDRVENLMYAEIIACILNDFKRNNPDKDGWHPIAILRNFDEMERKNGNNSNLAEVFKTIQKLFIQGYFGEYTVDNIEEGSDFQKLFSILGNSLYYTPKCDDKTSWSDSKDYNASTIKLSELISVAEDVKSYNYEYYRISHTKELNAKINRLRQLNLERRLSESYQKFCVRNKIDIDGSYSNIIRTVLDSAEQKDEGIVKEFKAVIRKLNVLENNGINEYNYKENLDIVNNAIAMQHIFSVKYRNSEYGKQCIIALKLKYREVIKLKRILLNSESIKTVSNDIVVVTNAKRIIESQKEEYLAGQYERALFELAIRNDRNKIGEFEAVCLELMGVKEFRGKRDKFINEMLEHTYICKLYSDLEKSLSEVEFNKIKRYNINELPRYIVDKIESKEFKSIEKQIEQKQLLSIDSTEVKNLVKELIYEDEDIISKIRCKVDNKEVDARNLIKYAIPNSTYLNNKALIDYIIENGYMNLNDKYKQAMDNVIKECGFCLGCIVGNLNKAELIPNSQEQLAEHIISITMN